MSVPYHRLFRVHPRYRWWLPLLALAILVAFWIVTQLIISVIVLVVVVPTRGEAGAQDFLTKLANDALDSAHPGVLAVTLVSLVVLLPAVLFAVRWARLGPMGQLSSVRFRLRWGWMARLLLPLLVLAILTVGVQAFGVPGVASGYFRWDGSGFVASADVGVSTVGVGGIAVAVILVVLLVPFQAAAEEYIFRGFVMQTIGSWVKNPIPGIAVSTVVFAFAHLPNGYNVWAILDVGCFGLMAAVLIWRTGGLEAGILAHALNNVGIFVLQAPGWTGIDASSGEESPGQLIYTVVTLGIYLLLVELMARRRRLVRQRPGVEVPAFRGRVPAWGASGEEGWSSAPQEPTAATIPRDDGASSSVGGRP